MMNGYGLLYHPQLMAQEYLRIAKQQRLARIARAPNPVYIPRIRLLRRAWTRWSERRGRVILAGW